MKPTGRHGSDVSDLLQAIGHAAVQQLGAVGLVEVFDRSLLGGLAGLDVVEGNVPGFGFGKKQHRR